MNREIKFRAIDLEGNIIHNVAMIEFFEDGHIIVNGEIPVKQLIQYIGFEDKNGKEIYQGDLLRFTNPDGEHFYEGIAEVTSETCGYNFKPNPELSEEEALRYDSTMFWHEFETDAEIVGNIFKNLEMIKS